MVSVTASTLDALLHLSGGVDDQDLEAIIDTAIDGLNLFGAELANMSGTAGSKTWSGSSKERGAIYLVARDIYYGVFKSPESGGIGPLSVAVSDFMSNPATLEKIKRIARQLTEIEVDVG